MGPQAQTRGVGLRAPVSMSGVRRPRHDDGKLTVLTGAAARGEQGPALARNKGRHLGLTEEATAN